MKDIAFERGPAAKASLAGGAETKVWKLECVTYVQVHRVFPGDPSTGSSLEQAGVEAECDTS